MTDGLTKEALRDLEVGKTKHFAKAMMQRLDEAAGRDGPRKKRRLGWKVNNTSFDELALLLMSQVGGLAYLLTAEYMDRKGSADWKAALDQCADIGNYAMMIRDNLEALEGNK